MQKIDNSITNDIIHFHIPRWSELPSIDLYLDQLVTLLESYLNLYIKDDKENKIITKTMINNYVKQGLIDPPIKKKYNKTHIAKLFVICILKQVYSINDIDQLIKLGVKTAPIRASYNNFCKELENAIYITFKIKDNENKKTMTQEQYILKNVVLSFANKIYVQKVFLKQ